ncbi:breast carcinoma-amplified sequence 4 [Gymnogyps californianus]|uniref:breast carcinoma-amplified sequence 4 n=1 Tax=Gymnogyps californianus TaxID=33616 RepID=UPI0021C8399A|nr:breast carcinoma-amplified sequence 4 [Gymnogyps californianus]
MSSAGDRRRAAAEGMLRPEELPEPRAGAAAAEESGTRCLTPPPGEEVKEMEETIEELLKRLDEFCGITDAIRSDTSEILDETIPLIKDKVMEMNHIYAKVDKLEAFVKMVAHHVSFLEEQVLEAEKSHGTFLNTVCKLFQCATISSFKNRHPRSAARPYDLPKLYRTEDFFPMNYVGTKYPNK